MIIASRHFNTFFSKSISSFSIWSTLKSRPKDPILGLVEDFKKDKAKLKVNLSVGAYRDDNGKPYVLNCVKEARKMYLSSNPIHEYLPIVGLQSFVNNSLQFAYSKECPSLIKGNICALQTLSGTGSLRLAMELLNKYYEGNKCVYLPNPTWPNHKSICANVGIQQKEYSYYDNEKKNINFNGLIEDIEKAPKKSIFLFHACAHNPTGMDLTKEQWKDILEVIQQKKHFVLFDMAYQGFASGDSVNDSYAVRLFANKGINIGLCQSYAKNLGLYGERVGCLSFICDNQKEKKAMESQLKVLARSSYSNPPKFGAMIVDTVFNNDTLKREWFRELKLMSDRIKTMRVALVEGLKDNGSTLDWSHITRQIGMFAYTGLSKNQVKLLKERYHIYMTNSGRISLSGLNANNVNYVAKCFHEVSKL